MRQVLPAKLIAARVRHGDYGSDDSWGLCGAFFIQGHKGAELKIIASNSDFPDVSHGWEHVSVSCINRCPNWPEMCFVKDLFWSEEETVIQFHPPKSEYVNMHPYCLHLWRDTTGEQRLPPSILVGFKDSAVANSHSAPYIPTLSGADAPTEDTPIGVETLGWSPDLHSLSISRGR